MLLNVAEKDKKHIDETMLHSPGYELKKFSLPKTPICLRNL